MELVAFKVTGYEPMLVGRPAIMPVAEFRLRPEGSDPVTAKLVGVLVAVIE
jgi:hypothetical protein